MSDSLANTRKEYKQSSLTRDELESNPVDQFKSWYDKATELVKMDANAGSLSTVDESGRPDARIVLLKGIEDDRLLFFTNYDSTKGKHIEVNPFVSWVFYWKELEQQVRISGEATKVSEEEATKYFHSRPRESQISVWTSQQSEVIEDRAVLENRFKHFSDKFAGRDIPKPENWGGYSITPFEIEFWQGRAYRLHDRFRYRRHGEGWMIQRLAP